MLAYRVKNMEFFKDGNVLGSRQLKPGEVLIVTEIEKQKIEQSGGVLEVIETLIKNPFKELGESAKVKIEPENQAMDVPAEVVPEVVEVQKRKAGRPKKVIDG